MPFPTNPSLGSGFLINKDYPSQFHKESVRRPYSNQSSYSIPIYPTLTNSKRLNISDDYKGK